MAIDLSYISKDRLEWVANAGSADEAAKMNIFDSMIDTVFRGGAKEAAIRELFSAIGSQTSDCGPAETENRMQNFLNLRSLMLPAHRQELKLEFIEHPNGSCDYSFHLNEHVIYERKNINADADIAELRNTRKAIEVDDYLIKLQNHSPQAASLVQRSDRFLIEQGKTGDCYALATMIGIMSNPAMQKKIENMAEITQDNKLRLKFAVDLDAPNIKNAPSAHELDQETLANICSDEEELAYMREKGYDLAIEDGVLRLDISEDKLKGIIGETRSAQTNSLIVNILEHFAGNLLVRLEHFVFETDVDWVETEDGDKKSGFTMLEIDTEVTRSDLRSDRESILAHKNRIGNYDPLIANLLGYAGGTRSIQPENLKNLSHDLIRFDNQERCLSSGATKGFIYVGIDYGQADQHGKYHGIHAMVLDSVEYDILDNPTGVYLKNPWGNREKPEHFSIQELFTRNVRFVEYYPADKKVTLPPENLPLAKWEWADEDE